jgi:hypothetical protein
MEKLLKLLIGYAKMQQGYEDMATNANRMEQLELYDEHIASAIEQGEKIKAIKLIILNLVP